MPPPSPIDSPHAAIAAMIQRLAPVPSESIPASQATGRVLAQEIVTDRPSPPASVSAMDGYAIRLEDAARGTLAVSAEARIGHAPSPHIAATATRIFTGSPVPPGADAVIKREDVEELESAQGDSIQIQPDVASRLRAGQNIRLKGENAPAGTVVLREGNQLTPPAIGALATFGIAHLQAHRRVRVHVLVTGDELADVSDQIDEHTIRDSNGPTARATIDTLPWARVSGQDRAKDTQAKLETHVAAALEESDAVILTGGVSMGQYDFVPSVLKELGCDTIFHKLPQRPGRPMLGAIGPAGQAILALPGNPVSVLVTLHRIGVPVLRHLGGFSAPVQRAEVTLDAPLDKSIPMWRYRPVRLVGQGRASDIANMGSGDIVSIAASDGFIELPPDAEAQGPWPYWPWLG